MYVKDWNKWNKRKKQGAVILFITAFALVSTIDNLDTLVYGYAGLVCAFTGLAILETTDWRDR